MSSRESSSWWMLLMQKKCHRWNLTSHWRRGHWKAGLHAFILVRSKNGATQVCGPFCKVAWTHGGGWFTTRGDAEMQSGTRFDCRCDRLEDGGSHAIVPPRKKALSARGRFIPINNVWLDAGRSSGVGTTLRAFKKSGTRRECGSHRWHPDTGARWF